MIKEQNLNESEKSRQETVGQEKSETLREQAEKALKHQPVDLQKLSKEDIQHLVHELSVHQIELEMQNEELRRIQRELEESRNRYSDLYDFAPVGYFTLDKKGFIIEVNLTGASKLGIGRDLLIKTPFSLYIASSSIDVFYQHLHKVFRTHNKQTCEIKLVDIKKNEFDALLESQAIQDSEGNFSQCRTAVIDITERKKAERKLAEQAFMLTNISDAVIGFGLDCRITYYSKSAEKMYGYSAEEVIGRTGLEVFRPSYLGITRNEAIQKLKNIGNLVTEAIHTKKDGSEVIVESHAVLLNDNHGKPTGLIGISRDITERKQTEAALAKSEERLKLAQKASNSGTWDWNMLTDEVKWSEENYSLYGLSTDYEPSYENWLKVIHPDDRDMMNKAVAQAVEQKLDIDIEFRTIRPDGNLRWLNAKGKTFYDEANRPIRMIGITIDITEHKRAEQATQEAYKYAENIVQTLHESLIVLDAELRVKRANQTFYNTFKITKEETEGKLIYELGNHQWDIPRLREMLEEIIPKNTQFLDFEVDREFPSIGRKTMMLNARRIYQEDTGMQMIILAIEDITERKKLESQLLRTQRMESIGTLAGGIAHDLNNMLTPMMMSLHMLKEEFKDEKSQKLLTILEKNSQRSADLIKQVISFTRGVEGERKPLQVAHIIAEIEKIAKETFPRGIEIRIDVPNDLWTISGDATQLHQVLMNLCVNARDAMPYGGVLSITASNFYVDKNYVSMHTDAKVGSYVVITVSDTGTGIPPEIKDRIFEPFFTTKEVGKGTGLGLSTALAIVKSHGGFIDVNSEVGKGTTFKVYFPAIKTELQETEEQTLEMPTGNGEFILVAEDEGSISEITISTLETYGYKVLIAQDGAEAVALYANNMDKIKVILMDLMMPVMDGEASIKAIRRINPDVKVIVVSGLAEKDKLAKIESARAQAILPKPYTAEKLLKSIHEVLCAK